MELFEREARPKGGEEEAYKINGGSGTVKSLEESERSRGLGRGKSGKGVTNLSGKRCSCSAARKLNLFGEGR